MEFISQRWKRHLKIATRDSSLLVPRANISKTTFVDPQVLYIPKREPRAGYKLNRTPISLSTLRGTRVARCFDTLASSIRIKIFRKRDIIYNKKFFLYRIIKFCLQLITIEIDWELKNISIISTSNERLALFTLIEENLDICFNMYYRTHIMQRKECRYFL